MKHLEKWSIRYAILFPWGKFFHNLLYRRITVVGLENIPDNKPVIYAPNHQNALMDALSIVFTAPRQTVFLARADIFKSKFIASLLYLLKIMPVYRIRDGKDSLDRNEEIFNKSIEILTKNKSLCLFPEGAHIGMRSMLPHKKAIPRIVFMAGERTNFNLDLQVIPVGISYSHYYHFRNDLLVQYGKPIAVKEYFEMLKTEGERSATFALRDRIYAEMEQLMVNVHHKDDYELYEQSFQQFRNRAFVTLGLKNNFKNQIKAEQFLNQTLENHLQQNPESKITLINLLRENKNLKEKLKLDEKTLQSGKKPWYNLLLQRLFIVFFAPISIYGLLVNGWLWYLSRFPIRKKIKDRQFWSSVTYGITLFGFTVWHTILFIVLGIVLHQWLLAFLLVLLSIPASLIAWRTIQTILRIQQQNRLSNYINQYNAEYKALLKVRMKLFEFYHALTN